MTAVRKIMGPSEGAAKPRGRLEPRKDTVSNPLVLRERPAEPRASAEYGPPLLVQRGPAEPRDGLLDIA